MPIQLAEGEIVLKKVLCHDIPAHREENDLRASLVLVSHPPNSGWHWLTGARVLVLHYGA